MINSISFNQENSAFSIATDTGFKLFNLDPFGSFYSSESPVSICEMLFNTSLVALVNSNNTRKLQIYNTKRLSFICDLDYEMPVLSVKLNKSRLVVCIEERIFIYDMSNMKLLHTINTIPSHGVIALSPSSNYLAYLPSTAGEVLLFDLESQTAVKIIEAHKNPISFLSFSFDGSMLATASDKGTVIRVFSAPSGDKLYQFRRGTYSARIYSLSFSLDGTMLSCSSDTDTIHIFKLAPQNGKRNSGIYDSLMNPVASYLLPEKISEMWEPQRDFAHAKLPVKKKSICAISQDLLLVATLDGQAYQYVVDRANGGECQMRIVKELA